MTRRALGTICSKRGRKDALSTSFECESFCVLL